MTTVHLKYECRHPEQFGIDRQAQYQVALEQIRWADELGMTGVTFCEHHGSEDGYLSSPMIFAAAAASVTRNIRLRMNLVMAYHDPIRVAEDIAVLDILSGGRTELAVLGGYVPSEFEMFGRSLSDRGRLIEEGVDLLKQAWTGEPFEWKGRRVQVTPKPIQSPPRLLIGGGAPVAARRAARLAEGIIPMIPEAYDPYEEECRKLGKTPVNEGKIGPAFLHVSEDPDRDWALIAPHALYETNCYARWQAQTGVTGIFEEMTDADALRESGVFQVLTPEQVLELADQLGPDGQLLFHPLMGGLDGDLAWQSLELFADKVWPHLTVHASAEPDAEVLHQPASA